MVGNSNTSDTSVAQVKTAERGSVIRQTFYVFRRWPILPMIVMVLLLVTGIFAPQISPNDPFEQNLSSKKNCLCHNVLSVRKIDLSCKIYCISVTMALIFLYHIF